MPWISTGFEVFVMRDIAGGHVRYQMADSEVFKFLVGAAGEGVKLGHVSSDPVGIAGRGVSVYRTWLDAERYRDVGSTPRLGDQGPDPGSQVVGSHIVGQELRHRRGHSAWPTSQCVSSRHPPTTPLPMPSHD